MDDTTIDFETPPTQSTTPGDGVTFLATSTTAVALDISALDKFYRRRIKLTASTAKIWVSFGPAATPLIDKSFAGGATIALGTKAENPIPIPSDGSITVKLDKSRHLFMHFQADAGTPVLIISFPARRKGGKQ